MADDELTPDQLQQRKDELKVLQDILDAKEKLEKKDQARYIELKKILKVHGQTADAANSTLETSRRLLAAYEEEAKGLSGNLVLQKQRVKVEQDLQRAIEAQVKEGKTSLEEGIKLRKESEKRMVASKVLVEYADKFTHSLEEQVGFAQKLGAAMGSVMKATNLGGINATGFLKTAGLGLKGLTSAAGITKFAFASLGGIIGSMINNIVNMVIGLANLELEFEKATGADKEFSRSVTNTYNELAKYGVSMKEASAAAQSLFKSYSDFTMLAADERQTLQNTTAALVNWGIASDDLAKGMQIQSKMFGLSGQGLERANREIFTLSQEIGVAPAEMASQFASAGNSLAKFGKDGMQTFKELARTSKLTGMEIGKLKQMTDKFDTFEGAATQAGKLNAALGSNMVNAMDLMMTTDPVARFEMIRDAIMDTGMTFEDMSYYQRNFYADAAGLADVSELALVMSGRTDMLAGTTQKSAKEYAKLAEQGKAVASIQEQFNAALAENAQEIIDAIPGGMDAIIDTIKKLPAMFAKVVRVIYEFGYGIVFLTGTLGFLRLAFVASAAAKARDTAATQLQILANIEKTLVDNLATVSSTKKTGSQVLQTGATLQGTVAAQAATIAQLQQSVATLKAGAASAAASPAVAFLGAVTWKVVFAIAALGASVIGVIWAIKEFAVVMATAGWGAIGAIGGIVALAFALKTLFGVVSTFGALPSTWAGVAAIVAIGAALAANLYLFTEFAKVMIEAGASAWNAIGGLLALAGAFVALGFALRILSGMSGKAGLIAFVVITAGITAMGYAMQAATSGIAGFTSGLAAMMTIDPNALLNLKNVIAEFSNITPPGGANTTFIDKILSLQNLNLTDSVKQVKELVTAINQTTTDEALAFAGAMDAIRQAVVTVQAAPAAPAAAAATKGGGGQQVTIEKILIDVTLDKAQTSKLITDGECQAIVAKYVQQ